MCSKKELYKVISSELAEIAKAVSDHLPKLDGVTKKDPKWMDNTYKVQTILRQHEYKFPHSPMVFNPFPVFLKTAKFGGMVYGVHIPTLEQVKKQSATYTFWHGYDHPANRISNVNATTSKSSDKSANASEPAPKKQKKSQSATTTHG